MTKGRIQFSAGSAGEQTDTKMTGILAEKKIKNDTSNTESKNFLHHLNLLQDREKIRQYRQANTKICYSE